MSRSHKKNPIMGFTTCSSERQDKKTWHRRWRASERTLFNSTPFDELDVYLPVLEKQVSDVWLMGKDGKQYWSIREQYANAEAAAQLNGKTAKERSSIKHRQLRKTMGK